tara:strand:- start:42 stop:440 length:399 start_codon:yes stop_codon:yes gene_type:complete
MNKFFVPNNVYEDRLEICKSCVYYFKPTGTCKRCLCFMKLKCRLAPMECPQGYWQKTTDIETPDDLPQEIIDEILDMWKDLKTGRAKDVQAKKRMIETYNVIHMTNYSPTTNCGSCISTCYDAIKKLYNKYA